MDMRFYWKTDRIRQGHFRVYWRLGPTNLGEYHSKHHPPAHHIKMRHTYLHTRDNSRDTLQGCVSSHNRYTTGKVINVANRDTRRIQNRATGKLLVSTTVKEPLKMCELEGARTTNVNQC